ncbi:hypothetical protein F4779DRAFT_467299 [Xylariaceae sp. FL0662B]|nr:hypothetical protein F4779DRAFT_467299 [Xylariaceae sp. FL0662B]
MVRNDKGHVQPNVELGLRILCPELVPWENHERSLREIFHRKEDRPEGREPYVFVNPPEKILGNDKGHHAKLFNTAVCIPAGSKRPVYEKGDRLECTARLVPDCPLRQDYQDLLLDGDRSEPGPPVRTVRCTDTQHIHFIFRDLRASATVPSARVEFSIRVIKRWPRSSFFRAKTENDTFTLKSKPFEVIRVEDYDALYRRCKVDLAGGQAFRGADIGGRRCAIREFGQYPTVAEHREQIHNASGRVWEEWLKSLCSPGRSYMGV